jgi:hypothetical protein
MTRTLSNSIRIVSATGIALIVLALQAHAQFTMRPAIGLQTMWFNGNIPASQDISNGSGVDVPIGGGIKGSNNGLHLGLELIPDPDGIIRFPLSLDAFFLSGRTTFTVSHVPDPTRRLLLDHTANVYSLGGGVSASFFKLPTLYMSAQATANYIPPTSFQARQYMAGSGKTISDVTLHPDTTSHLRFGAYLKLGTQVEFFDPLILDFSVGYGALNLLGKETDPTKPRPLLVVDSERRDPEVTLGYLGIGFSIIWKL